MTDAESREVTVVDVKMPFWSMVAFMIKWAFASIPAFVILGLMTLAFVAFFAAVLGVGRSILTPTLRPYPTPVPFEPMPTPVPRPFR